MFQSLRSLLCFAFLLGISIPAVEAATWQEHKIAGFKAFDKGDYADAVVQFEAALTIAYEHEATARDLGGLLENLATAFLADGQPQHAWEAVERWDRILAESADEPWVLEQQRVREKLGPLIREALGEPEPPRKPEGTAAATPAPPGSGDYAIHLESVQIEDNVRPSWAELKAAHPSQLAGKSLLVKPVDLGERGIFYRILAAHFADSAEAENVCRELKGLGQYCAVLSLE